MNTLLNKRHTEVMFVAPIGHTVIIKGVGMAPSKRGDYGIFTRIGSRFYHISIGNMTNQDGRFLKIPAIGTRDEMEHLLSSGSLDPRSRMPFHSIKSEFFHPIYYAFDKLAA